MMKHIPFVLIPMALMCASTRLLAQDEVFPRTFKLEGCVVSGGVARTSCSFPGSYALMQKTYPFSMRWDVSYSFPCRGHKLGLGLSARNSGTILEYAANSKEATFEGVGELILKDLDPVATNRATIIGDCSLIIHGITASPATEVLLDWQKEAAAFVTNINDARDALLLAESYSSLTSVLSGDVKNISTALWDMMNQSILDLNALEIISAPLGICEFTDVSCSRLLSRAQMTAEQTEKLDMVLIEKPAFADFHRLYAHINALPIVIDGQVKAIEDSFNIAKAELTIFFKRKLERQRNQAKKFMDKAKPFAETFDVELKKSLADLEALLRGNPT